MLGGDSGHVEYVEKPKIEFLVYRVTQFENQTNPTDKVFAFKWLAALYINKVYPKGAYIVEHAFTKERSFDAYKNRFLAKSLIVWNNVRFLYHIYFEVGDAESGTD